MYGSITKLHIMQCIKGKRIKNENVAHTAPVIFKDLNTIAMHIDHIFILTDDNGKIANELAGFGLAEGSNRVHNGQGTSNRKFYFENFFLEVLWVHNEQEINGDAVRPTGLWQRAAFRTNHFSPFGLCLTNIDDTNLLFGKAFKYQPAYFPNGMEIDIVRNEHSPDLPWTFRLPFKGLQKNEKEPTTHPNGISLLTKASFEYTSNADTHFLDHFKSETSIQFVESSRQWLTLTFDNGKQGKKKDFEQLRLTISY